MLVGVKGAIFLISVPCLMVMSWVSYRNISSAQDKTVLIASYSEGARDRLKIMLEDVKIFHDKNL